MINKSKIKIVFKNVLFSIIITVLICSLLELSFRLIYGPPLRSFNERIIKETDGIERFTLIENMDTKFLGKRLITNSLGLRDYRPPHKSQDKTQIIILGDSFTFGYGVQLEDSFPFILEKLMNEYNSEKQYEVINAGVPAYDTVQELGLLKKLLPYYSPNWIIVSIHSNDFLSPRSLNYEESGNSASLGSNRNVMAKYKKKVKWPIWIREKLRDTSSFYSWIFKYYRTTLIKHIPPAHMFLNINPDNIISSSEFSTVKEGLEEIHKIALENDSKVAIFMVVSLVNWEAYPYLNLHRALERFCKERCIYFIDPFKDFSKYDSGKLWVALNDSHYNKKGNEIAAMSIFKFFKHIRE